MIVWHSLWCNRSRQTGRTRLLFWASLLMWIVGFSLPRTASAEVQATLEKESAWTGEPVGLFITLFAPGPFSGTATFDLPEIPRTVIMKIGSPVVGSEEFEGKSMITQRHEFRVFSQQAGEVVIPSFQIQFSAKETFTSDPEPREEKTPELKFESQRPPSAGEDEFVATAEQVEVEQRWTPTGVVELERGDAVMRTVVRTATGTSSMMLPPFSWTAPHGVKVHPGRPQVRDAIERGAVTAVREDEVQYQFPEAGEFELPALQVSWWDPAAEETRTRELAGLTVAVKENQILTEEEAVHQLTAFWWILLGILTLLLVAVVYVMRNDVWNAVRVILGSTPIVRWRARRALRKACRDNDAAPAHVALLAWYQQLDAAVPIDDYLQTHSPALREQWVTLVSCLFGASDVGRWRGAALWEAFSKLDCRRERSKRLAQELPELNPTLR